ncbi:MAG: hypothetical protein ACPGWS_01080 [Solirubrobacterales bacterium]
MSADANYSLLPNPSPEEAAAAIAAIERFLADTSAPVGDADEVVSGWLRAALSEGVGSADKNSVW